MIPVYKRWLILGAALFPVLFSVVFVQVIQLIERLVLREQLYYPGVLIGVIVGAVCLALLPFRNRWIKLFSIALYFPIMFWIALVAGGFSFFLNWTNCC